MQHSTLGKMPMGSAIVAGPAVPSAAKMINRFISTDDCSRELQKENKDLFHENYSHSMDNEKIAR